MSSRKKMPGILERSALMGARRDADRIVALVVLVENLAKGERMALGEIASEVFGWDMNRVFLAIDHALAAGRIGKNGPNGEITAPKVSHKPPALQARRDGGKRGS